MTIETHNRTLELLTELVITSRERMVALDLSSLSDSVLARACLHGLTQKVADAASGAAGSAALGALGNDASKQEIKDWTMNPANKAAVQDEAERMMEDAKAKLEDGLWVAPRASAAGLSRVETMAIQLATTAIKASLIAQFGDAKKLTSLAKADRMTKVRVFISQDPDGWAERAQSELDRMDALVQAVDLTALF